MKGSLFQPFARSSIQREVDEELRLHLELLTADVLEPGMSWEDARQIALDRFGDVAEIRDQCVEISRRSHPLIHALKSLAVLIFLTGVLVRVFSPEFHVTRVGNILITVGVLSRLWIYARGLDPRSFISRSQTKSPLMLSDGPCQKFQALDQEKHTPLERVIFKK